MSTPQYGIGRGSINQRSWIFAMTFSVAFIFIITSLRATRILAQERSTSACVQKPFALSVRPRTCHTQRALRLNETVTRALASGEMVNRDGQSEAEADCYNLTLAAGQFAQLVVNQGGTDLALELFGPDQNDPARQVSLARVDRPNLNRGPEAISVIAAHEGNYLLQVFPQVSITNQPGQYEINFAALREARLPEDANRIAAERAITEGEERRYRGTACERIAAIQTFLRARDLWIGLGENYEAALASYGLGLTYGSLGLYQTEKPDAPFGSLGRYQGAIRSFNAGLSLLQEVKSGGEAVTYMNGALQSALASSYLAVGDFKEARQWNESALAIREQLHDDFGRAITLTGLGLSLVELGKPEKADECFEKALKLRRELNYKTGEAITLEGMARQAIKLQNYEQAEQILKQARELLPPSSKNQLEVLANVLSTLGDVQASRQQPDYQQAIKVLSEAVNFAEQSGNQTALGVSLYRLASVERTRGNFDVATNYLEEAIALSEKQAPFGIDSKLRAFSSSSVSVRKFYELYLDLLMDRHRREPQVRYDLKAFEVSERMHARGLVDQAIAADVENCVSPLPARPTQLEIDPVDSVTPPGQLGKRQAATLSQARPTPLIGMLSPSAHSINCGSLLDPQSSKWVAQATNLDGLPLQLPQVIDLLRKDNETLLLEYAVTSEHVYLWTISPTAQRGFVLAATREEIEELANELMEMMTATGGLLSTFEAKANLLCRRLIPPAAARLVMGYRRLVIVADGALLNLPFAVLGRPLARAGYAPLITSHELVNLPSMKALHLIRQRKTSAPKVPGSVIVFSGARAETTIKSGVVSSAFSLETEMMRKLFPAANVSTTLKPDLAATNELLGQYNIVHFATHTTSGGSYPLSGAGGTAPMSLRDIRSGDTKLALAQVYNLKLTADLVVLSACETYDYANQRPRANPRGDWLGQLTNGFTLAGARRVIASLWPIPDRATVVLLDAFYQSVKNGLPAPAALREAQLKMLQTRQWPPSDWAGFIAYGDWGMPLR